MVAWPSGLVLSTNDGSASRVESGPCSQWSKQDTTLALVEWLSILVLVVSFAVTSAVLCFLIFPLGGIF